MKYYLILTSIFTFSFSVLGQIDVNANKNARKLCFEKSTDRMGQRYVDWECGKDKRVLDCNEKLELDPGSNLILLASNGRPFDGACETCHSNGIIERKVTFLNGQTHGYDTTYYPSGCPQVVRNHIEGVENGTWVFYNDTSGLEAWRISFFNGEKHGQSIYFNQYVVGTAELEVKIGNSTEKLTYNLYESDTSKIEYYKQGLLDGTKTEYFPGSKVKKEVNYKEGVFNGPFIIYNEEGVILQELNYLNGQKDGEWKYFYENGQLLKIENWKQNLKVGAFKTFYIQGHLQAVENYDQKGRPDGEFKEWFPDEKVRREAVYKKGELIEEHVFDKFGNEIKTFGASPKSGKEDDDIPTAKSKKKRKKKKEK